VGRGARVWYALGLLFLCGFTLCSLACLGQRLCLLTLCLPSLVGLTLLFVLLLTQYFLAVRIENEPCDANDDK
jgi:hypothetical protein